MTSNIPYLLPAIYTALITPSFQILPVNDHQNLFIGFLVTITTGNKAMKYSCSLPSDFHGCDWYCMLTHETDIILLHIIFCGYFISLEKHQIQVYS